MKKINNMLDFKTGKKVRIEEQFGFVSRFNTWEEQPEYAEIYYKDGIQQLIFRHKETSQPIVVPCYILMSYYKITPANLTQSLCTHYVSEQSGEYSVMYCINTQPVEGFIPINSVFPIGSIFITEEDMFRRYQGMYRCVLDEDETRIRKLNMYGTKKKLKCSLDLSDVLSYSSRIEEGKSVSKIYIQGIMHIAVSPKGYSKEDLNEAGYGAFIVPVYTLFNYCGLEAPVSTYTRYFESDQRTMFEANASNMRLPVVYYKYIDTPIPYQKYTIINDVATLNNTIDLFF